MPLTNFGSILNFLEQLEEESKTFYAMLQDNNACEEYNHVFSKLIRASEANIKLVRRIRRENVTEMILENIGGFTRAPYAVAIEGAMEMPLKQALDKILALEKNMETYCMDASVKLKALSEVARALKQIAKKHTANLKDLS